MKGKDWSSGHHARYSLYVLIVIIPQPYALKNQKRVNFILFNLYLINTVLKMAKFLNAIRNVKKNLNNPMENN